MARPYWSGQLRISLVSFGIRLFPATETKSEIRFHQLSRSTGERVKYQKTTASQAADQDTGGDGGSAAAPLQTSDIVKGYEYRKGEYVMIEPSEIENLRIPSKKTLEITQFVGPEEVDPEYFEKPYFVVPENDAQGEAFAVVRQALASTKKVALGKIAFGGREHVIGIAASGTDDLPGMMAYTMRYAEELRKPAAYFADIKKVAIDEDQLALAKMLIERKAAKFAPDQFKDEYEAALRAMVEAKVEHHVPVAQDEVAPKSTKVVNLMDALRKSVQGDAAPATAQKKAPARSTSPAAETKKGITLVEAAPAKAKTAKTRKSA